MKTLDKYYNPTEEVNAVAARIEKNIGDVLSPK